jgi:parvulin-like peptidyl-prolyl isomerase
MIPGIIKESPSKAIFMKTFFLALAMAAAAAAQAFPPATAAAADTPPETVVATSGTRKITAGEVNKLVAGLPLQMRQNYERDPRGFLAQWFLLQKLLAMAEEQKLAEKSPYKETLVVQRMTALAQFMMQEKSATTVVPEEDLKKAYESKKDDYTMAKVKIIYIPFVGAQAQAATGDKKTLSEPEALAKAEGVVKKARDGGDFVKLVAENSEDPVSKERQGDFGPIRRGDKLPPAIIQAVFALKPGSVSDPVRQPNGYYILRLQELTPQAFEEVKDALFNDLKNARVQQWVEANAKSVDVKVEKPEFFGPARPK